MNRRNRTIIVVGVAVVFAALASWGVYMAIQQIPVVQVPIVERQMAVATDRVVAGSTIDSANVRLVAWPADSDVPGTFATVDEVVGRAVITDIFPNEPINESKLAPLGTGAGLAIMIPEGMLAMSIRVNDTVGVAGYVLPGSHVDVIVTVRTNNLEVSKIVLTNTRVLAANTRIDSEQAQTAGQPIPTSVVTLQVTPEDAERLALAQDSGTIVLALRNPLDTVPAETSGARMAALIGSPNPAPVRTTVQGRPRMVTPPPPPPDPTIDVFTGKTKETNVVPRGRAGGASGAGS